MIVTKVYKIASGDHVNDYYIDNHYHDIYEIVYYLNGHGITTIDNVNYTFGPNQFAIVSPNTIHNEKSCHEAIKLIYIRFSIDKDSFILNSGVFNDTPNKSIQKLFMQILSENKNREKYSEDLIESLISELAVTVYRVQKDKTLNISDNNFDYIEKYIRSNTDSKINGKTIAKNIGYNYDYFRKMFKNHFGLSINDYITEIRLNNAMTLLKSKKYTVLEISKISGFTTPSHFITLFKKKYKITPLEYMENINLKNISKDDANYKVYGKVK